MKNLLNEIKRVNELAGTQLTKEQEIAWIKNRLQELEFKHQASFDAYKKRHKMRPDTKVTIAGKETTVKDASKGKNIFQKIGAKLFGKKEEPIEMPKLDPKNPINRIMLNDPKRGNRVTIGKIMQDPDKYKHMAADVQMTIDLDPDGKKAQKYIDRKNKKRRDAEAERKAFNKKAADLKKWREENPELAKKKDDEERAKRRKRNRSSSSDWNYGDSGGSGGFGGFGGFGGGSSGGGFGGFGGGSFGGGGAGGSW